MGYVSLAYFLFTLGVAILRYTEAPHMNFPLRALTSLALALAVPLIVLQPLRDWALDLRGSTPE
jgi:hypothetical protein